MKSKRKTDRQILLDAAKLIERGWCKGVYARDNAGAAHAVGSRRAKRWCALGAILRAGKSHGGKAADTLSTIVGTGSIAIWNDKQRSKRPVIAALRKAAKLCERE